MYIIINHRVLRLNHCHSSKKKPSKSLPEKRPLSSSVAVAISDTQKHKPSTTICSTTCSVFLPDDILLLIFSCLNLFDLFKVELGQYIML